MDIKALKLVHICPDEKFIDGAYKVFDESFSGQNKFVVIKPPGDKAIRLIKQVKDLEKVIKNGHELHRLIEICESADLIVLYGLNETMVTLTEHFEDRNRFLWLILGAELYLNSYIFPYPLLAKATKLLADKLERQFNLEETLKKVYRKIRYRSFYKNKIDQSEILLRTKDVLKSIRLCGTLIEEEVDMLLKEKIVADNAAFLPFTFYPIEYFFPNGVEVKRHKKNILIGNSGAITNNHLDTFQLLTPFQLGDRQLITPLSYGDPYYIREINKKGRKLFGANFEPLLKFLPLDTYTEIVSSCGIIIMNHHRQQGVGNVLSSLYLGSKVYLSEKSNVYKYLKRIGCIVFCVEKDLNINNKDALTVLTDNQVAHNQMILKKEISGDVVVDRLRKSIYSYLLSLNHK